VATGTPWRQILSTANDLKSDLIVMGVRGRGAVDLFLFGSTAHHVVRQATCPVLTLR
jgi:nucleotide-binding universal stress UspA family protein